MKPTMKRAVHAFLAGIVCLSVAFGCSKSSQEDDFMERFREIDGTLYEEYVQPLQDATLPDPSDGDPSQKASQPSCESLIEALEEAGPALVMTAADRLEELRRDIPDDEEQEIGPVLDDMISALRLMHAGNEQLISGWRDADSQTWEQGLIASQRAAVQAADYEERLRQLAQDE
jgi:uncharacterized protein YcbK (DUF882 family)